MVLQFRSVRLARGDASLFWVPALFSGLQMKLTPSFYPDEVGFHHEVISSHDRGIYPGPNSLRCQLRTDLVEKREQVKDLLSFFRGVLTERMPRIVYFFSACLNKSGDSIGVISKFSIYSSSFSVDRCSKKSVASSTKNLLPICFPI